MNNIKEIKEYIMAVDFLIGNVEVVIDEFELDGFNDVLDKKIRAVKKFERKLIDSIKEKD